MRQLGASRFTEIWLTRELAGDNKLSRPQRCYLGSPGEPQLEDIVVASALDDFVARVIRHVVVFVLLEQVISTHAITVVQ